jgi:hypothetical protein
MERIMAEGLKDRNLQEYYEAMLGLFGTAGWGYLVEDLTKIYDAANKLEGIVTLTDLDFRRGQIDILKTIIAQPAVISAAYELLLEEEK